jgi:PIN domain nuclease of toxin-antitoxin system
VRLLLDSNAFIWAITRPTELSSSALQAIQTPQNSRHVSIASLWEMTIKVSLGKLALPANYIDGVDHIGAVLLPTTTMHVKRVLALPFHHRDPFDRMLIAQVIEEGLTIVTRDPRIAAYGVPVLLA